MQTETFELPQHDGHVVRGTLWLPDAPAVAALQLLHGLGEHHRRYKRFAAAATAAGFEVIAHDHRGHGPDSELPGWFAAHRGWQLLVDDALAVNAWLAARRKARPVVLLGHSMGSYVAQHVATRAPLAMDALALSASTWPSRLQTIPGHWLARFESLRHGSRGRSALLQRLGFGKFNKPFEPARTELDWLSRDPDEVDRYIADPLCGGPYTCGLWVDVTRGLIALGSDATLRRIDSQLPILLTGGSDDPVGGERGIGALAAHYRRSGHERLDIRLYPGGRHEMFNETNRDEFQRDLLGWCRHSLDFDAASSPNQDSIDNRQ